MLFECGHTPPSASLLQTHEESATFVICLVVDIKTMPRITARPIRIKPNSLPPIEYCCFMIQIGKKVNIAQITNTIPSNKTIVVLGRLPVHATFARYAPMATQIPDAAREIGPCALLENLGLNILILCPWRGVNYINLIEICSKLFKTTDLYI